MSLNYAKPVLSDLQANELIRQKIISNQPFFVGRYGSTELEVTSSFLFHGKWQDQTRYHASNNAGINPPDDITLMNYSIHTLDATRDVDIMAVWDLNHYDNIVNMFCPKAELVPLTGIEPYYFPQNPWSELLAGKKVLVIHPFENSIRKQYAIRQELFRGTNILPQFELKIIKAAQSMGNVHANYFDNLKSMQDQILDTDFDYALIGCGAYGLPLGSFIKRAKRKSVFHLGGALQILFGIMGNRWTTNERIMRFYNERWTRPGPEETPQNSKAVENACYW